MTYRTRQHSLVEFYRSTRQALRGLIWRNMSMKVNNYCAVHVVVGVRY